MSLRMVGLDTPVMRAVARILLPSTRAATTAQRLSTDSLFVTISIACLLKHGKLVSYADMSPAASVVRLFWCRIAFGNGDCWHGGGSGIRTHDPRAATRELPVSQTGALSHSAIPPEMAGLGCESPSRSFF